MLIFKTPRLNPQSLSPLQSAHNNVFDHADPTVSLQVILMRFMTAHSLEPSQMPCSAQASQQFLVPFAPLCIANFSQSCLARFGMYNNYGMGSDLCSVRF